MGLECRERVEAVLFVPLDMDIYLAVMRAEPIVGLAVDLDLPFRVLLFVKPVLRHDLLSVLEYPACSGVKLAVDRPHAVLLQEVVAAYLLEPGDVVELPSQVVLPVLELPVLLHPL